MSSNAPVYVYNANTVPVNVNVNNAPSGYQINGASATNSYAPVLANGGTTWNTNVAGTANVLGLGENSVLITPSNSSTPTAFTVTVPSGQQLISLQLYIFFATEVTASWVLLNNGQLIGQDTVSIAGSASASASPSSRKKY